MIMGLRSTREEKWLNTNPPPIPSHTHSRHNRHPHQRCGKKEREHNKTNDNYSLMYLEMFMIELGISVPITTGKFQREDHGDRS